MRRAEKSMGLGLKNRAKRASDILGHWFKNEFLKPNLFNLSTHERFGVIFHEPSDMCITDRVMLYALARGLRPVRALEIGARWGGSARIITNAMEENGIGHLVGIDPAPESFIAKSRDLHGRYTLVPGYSPDITEEATKLLDGELDFVLIDGMHTHDAVLADINGVLPYLSCGAHVILHDTYHQGINAVADIVTKEGLFIDCGFLTRNPAVDSPLSYQGLRILRYGTVDSHSIIACAYRESNHPEPVFSEEHWNYDPFLVHLREQSVATGIEIDNTGREVNH